MAESLQTVCKQAVCMCVCVPNAKQRSVAVAVSLVGNILSPKLIYNQIFNGRKVIFGIR